MKKWLPDQVYRDESHALEVLRFLICAYSHPGNPARGPFVLGVALGETGELIGHVGLSPLGGEVEVGYAIQESHQGKGYATEAVAAMTAWALATFALSRIVGVVSGENPASARVLAHAGFSLLKKSERTLHGKLGLVKTYQLEAEA